MTAPFHTRFAPSPTGHLHLGHAYSALFAEALARQSGGRFQLRIEDIDGVRCKAEHEAAIFEDLAWLGLEWEQPVRRQSDHMDDYAAALARLDDLELLYPCFCTRKDIRDEIKNANHAPHHGPEGPHYPGICRNLDRSEAARRKQAGEPFALRLDNKKALAMTKGPLVWRDLDRGDITARPERFGDVVLARKDIPTSYHLAVTIDDNLQGVTLVSRGEDLMPSTDVHRLLQELLDLNVPEYHHHKLLDDDSGQRLAKRDNALTIKTLRQSGKTAYDVREMAGVKHP